MKKIIYIISLFVSSVLYTSCDALDLAPEDYFGSGNYWNNEDQVEGFMYGMHSQLRGNYNMFYCLQNCVVVHNALVALLKIRVWTTLYCVPIP